MATFPCSICGSMGAYVGPSWVATATLIACPSCGNPMAASLTDATAETSLSSSDAGAETSLGVADNTLEQQG